MAGPKPVFGLPGNPVSCIVTFDLFVAPTLARLSGPDPAARRRHRDGPADPQHRLHGGGREDYVQVRLERRDGGYLAHPVFGKSNLIYTLVKSEGMVTVALDKGGLERGRAGRGAHPLSLPRLPGRHPAAEARRRFWEALLGRRPGRPGGRRADAGRRGPGPGDRRGRCGPGCPRRTTTPRPWTGWPCGPRTRWGASEASPIRLTLGHAGHLGRHRRPAAAGRQRGHHGRARPATQGDDAIEILAPVAPWQHVRAMGEDIVATELVLPAGPGPDPGRPGRDRRLRPHRGRPSAAGRGWPILPTGTELVEPGSPT